MIASILAALKIPDLKKRIFFVFTMFAVYVVGLHIPVPGVDTSKLAQLFGQGGASNLFDLLNAFTGGAFKKFTIFALGIMPYINASIVMQLLTIAIPSLEQLAKEGESGRKKIGQYTRWLTGGFAIVQAIGMIVWLQRSGGLPDMGGLGMFQVVITLAAGTAFLMWMGELISEQGIGNGVSLVIFAGIVASLPTYIVQTYMVISETGDWGKLIMLGVVFLLTVMGIVAVTQAQRNIPIMHVKRVVGRKMYGGQSSELPMKVNSAGVIPIIFAVSIQMLPATVAQVIPGGGFGNWVREAARIVSPGESWVAIFIYAMLVIFFTYFYTAVVWNVNDVADNLKKWGSFIPGIRPGRPTVEYLDRVMTRLTLAGALFLATIAVMQYIVPGALNLRTFPLVGGTSLLIVVGVALDTMRAIESQLLMRHYEGFIK